MSESESLKAFLEAGSEEGFAALVQRYAGLVYSVAKRRLANAGMAEDITQIVFIRLAKSPPKVRSHAELAAWLHRATVNVTIDTWRSETRRRNRELQAAVMEPTNPENAVWEELSPNVDDALNQLSDEDRQVLLLRFFGQKSMRDVGSALGVSEDAAKMRVSRALDRIRTQLGARSTACTAAVLGTILAERAVEAAPNHLVSRLEAIKLPAAAGMSATGGLLAGLLQITRFKFVAGAIVLTVIGVSTAYLNRPLIRPASTGVSTLASTNTEAGQNASVTRLADRGRFNASTAREPAATPPAAVRMSFHVLDSSTGGGLADAKIHAAYFGVGGMGEAHDMLADNNGAAAIPEADDAAKRQAMNVFVVAQGHVPKVVSFRGADLPVDYWIRLDPAVTAGGLVMDDQGMPVAGVKIMIDSPGNKEGEAENVDFQRCPVTNRDDGRWSCSYIPRDYTNEIPFILTKAGYAVTFVVVPVARVDLTNLVLVINRGVTITGQITDRENRPIANALIRTISGYPDKRQSARTDGNGVFTLMGVPGEDGYDQAPPLATNGSGGVLIRGLPGNGEPSVELAIQAEGFGPQTNKLRLSGATNTANFTLLPGNIFRGQVVDEAGYPIPNAIVQTDWNNQGTRAFEWQTRTDANGRFEWNSAPEKPILYWFEAEGYQWQRDVTLAADGSEHLITLKSAAVK